MSEQKTFKEWGILELMGHRRLSGLLSEMQLGGAAFIRIDIPQKNDTFITQIYSPQAVYCITPTMEEIARALAVEAEAPISRWDISRLLPLRDGYLEKEDEQEDA